MSKFKERLQALTKKQKIVLSAFSVFSIVLVLMVLYGTFCFFFYDNCSISRFITKSTEDSEDTENIETTQLESTLSETQDYDFSEEEIIVEADNESVATPDITLKNLTVTTDSNLKSNISVNIVNIGSTDSTSFKVKLFIDPQFTVTADSDGNAIYKSEKTISSLGAGKQITFSVKDLALQSGNRKVYIVADYKNSLIESNENNNITSSSFTVPAAQAPTPQPEPQPEPEPEPVTKSDLIIQSISSQIVADNKVDITIIIKNVGVNNAGSFKTILYVDPNFDITSTPPANAVYAAKKEITLPSISSGQTYSWTSTNIQLPEGNRSIQAFVDSLYAVDESNEGNNFSSSSVTVPPIITEITWDFFSPFCVNCDSIERKPTWPKSTINVMVKRTSSSQPETISVPVQTSSSSSWIEIDYYQLWEIFDYPYAISFEKQLNTNDAFTFQHGQRSPSASAPGTNWTVWLISTE